jgi:hypothetical protein
MPRALPVGMMHELPGQQSALLVQPPHTGMHTVAAHTSGGVPLGFGTHGMPLQQSALEAQAPPGLLHVASEHRGTPTLS